MPSPSRALAYRRSFNRHQRAARENTQVNFQKFHENIKDLKQYREQVKKYMWEWLDLETHDRVDSKVRDAVTSISRITSYFEDVLNITSPRTQKLLNDTEKLYQDEIREIRRENETKIHRLEEKIKQIEKSLEEAQSDNKQLSDRCEGYRKQIERLQDQMSKQTDEETQKRNALSEEIQKLSANLKERDDTISRLDTQQKIAVEEIGRLKLLLKENEDNFNKETSKLQEENETLIKNLSAMDEKLAILMQEKENDKHQIAKLNAKLKQSSSDALTLRSRISQFQEEESSMRNTIDKLQQHLTAEKHAKDDALTRLSAAAANKLRDNNPAIADLSDPNRPMKLAEKLSELYDNEWTNAMETMEENGISEEEGVQILLNILTNVFTLCKDGGNKVMSAIENYIAVPAIDGLDLSQVKIEKLPKFQSEMLKPLKDYRKSYGEEVIPFIKEVIIKKISETPDGQRDHVLEDCKEYIDKAVEYCWMMRVQDPPVHIEWDFSIDSVFDINKFRSYTKGGNYVSFVVWPVLYLHEGGPLLAKGVVQGKRKK